MGAISKLKSRMASNDADTSKPKEEAEDKDAKDDAKTEEEAKPSEKEEAAEETKKEPFAMFSLVEAELPSRDASSPDSKVWYEAKVIRVHERKEDHTYDLLFNDGSVVKNFA